MTHPCIPKLKLGNVERDGRDIVKFDTLASVSGVAIAIPIKFRAAVRVGKHLVEANAVEKYIGQCPELRNSLPGVYTA